MLRLITLDVNNTLLRVRGSVGELYSKTAQKYGLNFDSKTLDTEFRKSYGIYYNKYPNFGVRDGMSTEGWWSKVVSKTFKNVGCQDYQAVQDIASFLYIEYTQASKWEVFPEVKTVLQHLQSKGFTLGVVSNFDERLTKILDSLDLIKYFSFILCSTEVKIAKPSLDIFRLALEQGGASPKEALHVGDNINLDYYPSITVGMSAYLVDRYKDLKTDGTGVPPDRVIPNLNPLMNL